MLATNATLETVSSSQMTINQTRMHLAMIEAIKEKNEGWTIHLLDKFFSPLRLHVETSLGVFSWSASPILTKWLATAHASHYGDSWTTPSEIARNYLTLKYPKRRVRCRTSQWKSCVADRGKAPRFTLPGIYPDGVYLDLDAAYWQIVRAIGWDVSYDPGKILSVHSSMLDFPYRHEKLARNCLVSLTLPHRMTIWTGTELKYEARPNKFINLILYRAVMDVLNGVAQDVIKAGAVYVYSDGYIIPRDRLKAAIEAIDGWGLTASLRHDPRQDGVHNALSSHRTDIEVRAPGSYRIGTYMSLPYQRSLRRQGVSNVDSQYTEFLRPRFRAFAEKAQSEWEYAE